MQCINAFLVISELMASLGKVLRSFGDIGKKFTIGLFTLSKEKVRVTSLEQLSVAEFSGE